MVAFPHAGIGVHQSPRADETPGIEHGVASGLYIVAENCAQFGEAGVHFLIVRPNFDGGAFAGDGVLFAVDRQVAEFCPRAEVGTLTEDAVPDVGEVRGVCAGEEDAVFRFAGVSENGVCEQDHVFPNIGPMPDDHSLANVRRTDDVRARFDDGGFGDVDRRITQVRAGVNVAEDGLAIAHQAGDVFFEGFERVPDIFASVKKAE